MEKVYKRKNPYRISVKLKETVDSRVLEFLDLQGNICDTILYGIEKLIAENGLVNMQKIIPPERDLMLPDGVEANTVISSDIADTIENNISDAVKKEVIKEEFIKEKPKEESFVRVEIPDSYLDDDD